MPLETGSLLAGKYRIESVIGQGAYGRVYRAWDTRLNRWVAVKELRKGGELGSIGFADYVRRFEREAQVQARFNHPNIVHVYELLGPEEDTYYLVMEYVDGKSLKEMLEKRRQLPLVDVLRIFHDILNGLKVVHADWRDIVHRDIKPSNILLTSEGRAKLADFGLAQVGDESMRSGAGQPHPGTPAYMSPEQETTQAYLYPTSDIFSAGCVLFEMLTGQGYKFARSRGQSLADLRPDLPAWVSEALEQALARHPEQRPAGALALWAILEQGMRQEVDARRKLEESMREQAASQENVRQETLANRRVEAQDKGLLHEDVKAGRVTEDHNVAENRSNTNLFQNPRTRFWFYGGVGVLALLAMIGFGGLVAPKPGTPTSTLRMQVAATTPIPFVTVTFLPTFSPSPTYTSTPTTIPTPSGGGWGQIYFLSRRDGKSDVFAMNPDGLELLKLTDSQSNYHHPAFSPDGRSMIVTDFYDDGKSAFYLFPMDGSARTVLTIESGNNMYPSWSPDGSRIVFFSDRDGDYDIYTMDPDGSRVAQLTTAPGYDGVPRWSPDGSRIAFLSDRNGDTSIFTMNADGTGQSQLTNAQGNIHDLAWSPDGRYIAFELYFDFTYDICIINADGTGQMNITNSLGDDEGVRWSPDSQSIAFHSNRDGNYEIYVMNYDGAGLRRLTNNSYFDYIGSWSPDNQRLVYSSYRNGNWEVFTINVDGSDMLNITNHPANDEAVLWR